VSYYRLSAYCIPLESQRHVFRPGARFDQLVDLYDFDRRLRAILHPAIERIEVSTRASIGNQLGLTHGAFCHTDPANFRPPPEFDHARWTERLLEETERSNETFVRHYRRTYAGFPVLPVWMAVEIMSFGALSQLYRGLLADDQRPISQSCGVHRSVFASWLHTVVYVRNVCAHHGRLWNRSLAIAPRPPRHDPLWQPPLTPDHKRVFAVLLAILTLLRTGPGSAPNAADWRARLEELLADREPWQLRAIGFPDDWREHPLWTGTAGTAPEEGKT